MIAAATGAKKRSACYVHLTWTEKNLQKIT